MLPLIVPLNSPNGYLVHDCHKLVFNAGKLSLYYSYQHPLAFYVDEEEKVTIRTKFWNRQRGNRIAHMDAILFDVEIMFGSPTFRLIPEDNFEDAFTAILGPFKLSSSNIVKTSNEPVVSPRRKVSI